MSKLPPKDNAKKENINTMSITQLEQAIEKYDKIIIDLDKKIAALDMPAPSTQSRNKGLDKSI